MNRAEYAASELRIARAWRALMLADNGGLKPDAEIIMRDMERETG